MPRHHGRGLRGTDALYQGFRGLLDYSQLYDHRKIKDYKELTDRLETLDNYLIEKKVELKKVEIAEQQYKDSAITSETVSRIFKEAKARANHDITELEKQRDMVLRAKEDYPKWQEQRQRQQSENEIMGK